MKSININLTHSPSLFKRQTLSMQSSWRFSHFKITFIIKCLQYMAHLRLKLSRRLWMESVEVVWAELISEVFEEEDDWEEEESESSAGAVESFSCWRCKADKGSVSERGRCCGNNVIQFSSCWWRIIIILHGSLTHSPALFTVCFIFASLCSEMWSECYYQSFTSE